MFRFFGCCVGLILSLTLSSCSGDSSSSSFTKFIINPPAPGEFPEVLIVDTPRDQLAGKCVKVTSVRVSGNQLIVGVSHSGGCVEDNYVCYMSSAAFMESHPVQANLYIRNDSDPDPCDGVVFTTAVFDLSTVADLYRMMYGDSGSIGLNIYDCVDGVMVPKFSVIYDPSS